MLPVNQLAKESTDARSNAQHEILRAMSEGLRAAMEANNETYRSLAEKAGVSSGTISSILSGRFDPRLMTLLRVAAALGIPNVESVFGEVVLPTDVHLASLRAGDLEPSRTRK